MIGASRLDPLGQNCNGLEACGAGPSQNLNDVKSGATDSENAKVEAVSAEAMVRTNALRISFMARGIRDLGWECQQSSGKYGCAMAELLSN